MYSLNEMEKISIEVARQLVLRNQLLPVCSLDSTPPTLPEVASRLASVQYDPLPVIVPNHYMVFWNRLTGSEVPFSFEELDEALYKSHSLLEFFGLRRVTSIIPSTEFPLYRSASRLSLGQGWTQRIRKRVHSEAARHLIERLKKEGPLTKREMANEDEKSLLHTLFWLVPEVVIVNRRPGVFREAEYAWGPDVLPHVDFDAEIDTENAVLQLLLKTVRAFGLCTARHAAFWFGCRVRDIAPFVQQLAEQEQIVPVRVGNQRSVFYVIPEDLDQIEKKCGGNEKDVKNPKVSLLTPLDNLVRDRMWLEKLFGYSFKIEYFQVKGMRWHTSILVGNEIIGFIDPKVDRRKHEFIVKEVVLQKQIDVEVAKAIITRLQQLTVAHQCTQIRFLQPPSSWIHLLKEMGSINDQQSLVLTV